VIRGWQQLFSVEKIIVWVDGYSRLTQALVIRFANLLKNKEPRRIAAAGFPVDLPF
jgi:hypothetical protein